MKKILLLFLVAFCGLTSYAQRYLPNGTLTEFTNGVRVNKNLRIPSDTLITADTGAVAMVNGVVFYKYGTWQPIGVSTDSTVATDFLLSKTLATTPRLFGIHPVTGKPIYIDSVHRYNEPENWPTFTIEGRKDGDFGPIPYNFPSVLDAGAQLLKSYRINGAGNTIHWDSMQLSIRQKVITNGYDTAISVFFGPNVIPSFYIAQSKGVVSNTNFYVGAGNAIAMNTATGLSLTDSRNLTLSVNSKIRFYQQPGILERSYFNVPVFAGINFHTILTNDTVSGSVYPIIDSTKAAILDLRFREHGGFESMKYRFMADGRLFRASIPNHTSVSTNDSLLTTQGGVDKRIRIADILALGGGGGISSFNNVGSSPNSAGASVSGSVATLQPADGSNPGVVTAGTQTIGGAKTFSSNSTQFTPGTNNESVIRVNTSSGTPIFQVGPYPLNTAYAGFWAGNVTPSSSNFFMQANDVATLFKASTSLNFRIGSSDKIVATATGIGINTTSPETVLDVNGEVQLRSVSDASVADSTLNIENGKIKKAASNAHNHSAADITSGTLAIARLDTTNGVTSKASRDKLKDSLNALKTPVTLTDGATITQTSYNARVVSGGNRTLAISSPENGQTYTLVYVQDGTGGRKLTGPDGSDIILNKSANDSTLIVLYRQNNGWFISSSVKTFGTYTPTLTSTAVADVITPYLSHWVRNGNEVTVTVFFQTTVTGAGSNASVRISLPIPSALTDIMDLHGNGTAASITSVTMYGARVNCDTSNDAAVVYWGSLSGDNDIEVSFTYTVK